MSNWQVDDKVRSTIDFDEETIAGELVTAGIKKDHLYLVGKVLSFGDSSYLYLVGCPYEIETGEDVGWPTMCFEKVVTRSDRRRIDNGKV